MRLLDEVEPLLEALDRTLAQLARRNGRQTLRIRLPALFANELFIPRLASSAPPIRRSTCSWNARPTAGRHPPTADISIVLADSPPQRASKSVRLFSSRFIAVCAAEHAGAVAQLGREIFGTLPLIVDRTRPFAWSSWAQEVGLETPEPRQVIEFDTMLAVVRAAERGLGVALVPGLLCESWLRSGALVQRVCSQLPPAILTIW